ncbi:unnamed protein product [Aphanomyces euteiches]|uniref:Anamorsin homolog n=1 Tax=Aphanomyces euteiches TaxID=100861 RepID=A0A6G0XMM7_9STRA|nr:hypothetical protein Ae201684_003309 [Aphanomyces euteiches]KAH9098410.1 hypothetical protein Ae201684P_017623 [Aphanomyces euteiches]KAH9155914.1 hypothetical protein AeRB84_002146 [Aphanomyces euteiches]
MLVISEAPYRTAADEFASSQAQNVSVIDIQEAEKKDDGSAGAKVVFFGGLAHFATLHRVLQPGGSLEGYIYAQGEDNKNAALMQLLLQGFLNSNVELQGDRLHLRAEKSGFTNGASATVSFQRVLKPKWTVVADDEDDIMDEDDLLDDTDDVLKKSRDDCGVSKDGKKRRCKDCTCGRKDEDEQPFVTEDELKEMVSNCGNCYKGDAFRCGSCPYLGQPAFKPGMGKVVLNLDNSDDF